MITAHTASTAKLKSDPVRNDPPITADDSLSPDQQAAMTSLQGKTGADFDSAYAAAQVERTRRHWTRSSAYAARATTPALQDFAKQMIPTVTAHLNLAKGLK